MTQHIGCKPGWTWKAGQPLEVMSCGSCHIVFAIPEGMAKRMRATGASFHCPNGDRIRKRLRRQFEDERARHMAGQHPDFPPAPENESAGALPASGRRP